jgi:hypothetical protein
VATIDLLDKPFRRSSSSEPRPKAANIESWKMKVRDLATAYLTDPDSPFNSKVKPLRYVTQEGYKRLIARLDRDMGDRELAALGTRDIIRLHASWIEGDKIAMAHSLAMLRTIIGFGATILEHADCQRLKGLLADLRFQNSARRTVWLTESQGEDVRDFATLNNYYAIALAQALQSSTAMRQKDILGEWIPIGRPELSTIISADGIMKWVRGITREEISADMILTHQTSKRGQVLSFDLKNCPAVEEEWFSAPPSGPLIIDPETRLPYEGWKFRRIWRRMATLAGVPKNIWNMDTRAGRITERFEHGAALEDIRQLAGHERLETTRRNCRNVRGAITRALRKKNTSGDPEES